MTGYATEEVQICSLLYVFLLGIGQHWAFGALAGEERWLTTGRCPDRSPRGRDSTNFPLWRHGGRLPVDRSQVTCGTDLCRELRP